MEDITYEELKALVAANSRAIGRQERLEAERWEKWHEAQRASAREHDRRMANLDRRLEELERLQAQDREQLLLSRKQWQEELEASRRQWQEELAASRREHDRMEASLQRSIEYANQQLGN